MSEEQIQAQIFQNIKTKLPSHISMVDEIASILDVSTDSAYRRIRGEKPLSLDEACRLCSRYQVSLDSLLNLHSNVVSFTGNFVKGESFRFEEWLQNVVQQVKYMNDFSERQLIYLAKDLTAFQHYFFREVAAFKYYFWMKNIVHHPSFASKKFSLVDYPDELFELGRKALHYYNQIDTIEVWNIETINSTIRQVEYYHESNLFSSEEELYAVYEALEKTIDHLELQAMEGRKFSVDEPGKPMAPYQMYFNEIVILENSLLAILNGKKTAFLVHNVINVMMTRDVAFCDNMYAYIQNLLKKSTLISTVSERERSRFFKYLRQKIESRKQNLKV